MQAASHETVPPVYYPSNTDGLLIRNAVTGVPYPFRVGSKASRQLYCVHDTRGNITAKGYLLKSTAPMPNKTPNRLYYDGPEQFFRHWRLPVDTDLVKRWKERVVEFDQP
jgi:hypothetical protein